jgi:RND family efflux transporter MFP subunit
MMFKNLNIRSRFYSTCLMLLIPAAFIACTSSESTQNQPATEKFLVINPIIKDTTYVREYVADIHSLQNTELRAKAGGYLETIHVDEGDYVKAGQLLFTISSQQYAQELLKAEASLTSAIADSKAVEVEFNNTKTLVEKNIVSQSELELAQARLEALKAKTEEARAHVESTRLQLSFARIKAPFSGYINRIPNKVGSLIDEGELLTTISNNDQMLVYFNVSEKEYLDYIADAGDQQPREVELILANDQPYAYKGKVETAESEIDKSTGSIAFRAKFPNPKHILRHGNSGKILVSSELKKALLIPQKSTFEIQENLYVYVVDDSNTIRLKKINPTLRIPHLYVIESGLTEQDKILYEGIQRVQEGDRIAPELQSWNDVLSQLSKF